MNQIKDPCPTSNTVPCTDAISIKRLAHSRALSLASLNGSTFTEYPITHINLKSTDHSDTDKRGKGQFA